MSLNWKEIDAVLSELPLANSHVQKIRQPDFSSAVFDLFSQTGRFSMYVDLAQNRTRLHRLTRKVENTVRLQRFAQLLRSRIGGARITGACQIREDRIVKIELKRADVISVLNYLFLGGPAPLEPFPECGFPISSVDVELGCDRRDGCI